MPQPEMTTAPDVLEEVQLRAVGASVVFGLAVIALLVLYALLPGRYPLDAAPFTILVVGGGLGVVLTKRMPWRELIRRRAFVRMFVSRALSDMALVSAAIAISGGSHSDLYLIYLVMCVFFAGVSYPRPIRVLLTFLMMVAYVVTLAAVGWEIGTATIVLRLGMIAITAGVVDVMSIALRRELYFRDRVNRDAEQRAKLWSTVAGLGREAGSLDEGSVLAWAVDAVGQMGFEAANFCMFTEDRAAYRVVEARGLPDAYVRGLHRSDHGMARLVIDEGRTVVVGDYHRRTNVIPLLASSGFRTVVATPIWVEGEMAGVLVGGTRRERSVEAEEVAAIELLAAHAAHAIEASRSLERQRRDAAHFRSLITSAPDAMVVMDVEGYILEANHQVGRLFGYRPEAMVGVPVRELLGDESRHFVALYRDTFAHDPRTLVVGDTEEVYGMRSDGSLFPMEVVLGPIEAPEGLLVTATVRDVTERREFERKLAHQATHDHLTGLPNRVNFVTHLSEALAGSRASRPQVAVCFLDIDHFKYVNDSRGHTSGDELLVDVAGRIAATVRTGDLVARFGGDEFAVLVTGLTDRQGAVAYAWRLLASFDRPFVLDGVECYLSASVGIAFGARGDDPIDLLRNADAAMYHAKQRGRACVELFDDALTARAEERLDIESSLHQAVLNEQLSLVYQPVLSLPDRIVVGVEALLRWDHPERGPIPPVAFVPIAEESGLILQIGRWVMSKACESASRWTRAINVPDRFSVSVNVSNRQLEHDRLVAEVASVLDSTQLSPSSLVLEITESFFMRDMRGAVRRLKALKQLGVRIAIDDFGTGFSSLNSLARLPIDQVKIDRSFTESLGTRNDAIVGAVIDVAGAFDLEVVAEGVESESQLQRLVRLGCHYGQGFLLGAPLPAADIDKIFLGLATSTSKDDEGHA